MSSKSTSLAKISPAEAFLLSVVDWGLAGIVLVAPWFMGGRHPLGQFVLVVLALAVALAWCGRQCLSSERKPWNRSAAEWVLLAGIALVVLQLLPLPPAMLKVLSPHTAELLPLWNPLSDSPVHLGTWNQVSLTPAQTASGLVMFISYTLIFLVAVQRIAGVQDVERILRWLSWSVILMAAIGIVQYLAGNGKYLWIYQHPYRDAYDSVKGPFMNQNHFAHLLALGLGPLLWSIQQASSRGRTSRGKRGAQGPGAAGPLTLALGVVLFAGLMTFSRGGAAAMLLATVICVGAYYRASLLGKRFALGLAAVFVLIGAALLIHGLQRVTERLDDYGSGSLADLDKDGARRQLWTADFTALKDYFVLGSGAGSHCDVYPMYYSRPSEVELTHAENGYLQVALETGLPGLALLLAGIGLCGRWCLAALRSTQSQRVFVCAAAVTASLAVSVLHSLVDFVWYIPSLMAITALLAACALRLCQLRAGAQPAAEPTKVPLPRMAFAGAMAVIVVAGGWMASDRFCAAMAAPHWEQYLARTLSDDPSVRAGAVSDEATFTQLAEVLRWTPEHGAAHVCLARACLRRFEQLQLTAANVMPLNQIRETVLDSGFTSRAQVDAWMLKAFGKHCQLLGKAAWHSKQGLALCPLLGEAYDYLNQLCFLDGTTRESVDSYVAQALSVRPYSSEAFIDAGAVAALRQDIPNVIKYWGPVLRRPSDMQIVLIDTLAQHRLSLGFVTQALRPNLPALRLLLAKYSQLNLSPGEMRPLLVYYAAAAEAELKKLDGESSARVLVELGSVYRGLDELEKAIACLEKAVAVTPNDFEIHHTLGTWLCEQRQFDAAQEHLAWCVERHPADRQLQDEFVVAAKGRVQSQSTARRDTGLKQRSIDIFR